MKIALVLRVIAFSGAENVANALVTEFEKKGHEVCIILTGGKGPEKTDKNVISIIAKGPQGIRQIKRSLLLRKALKKEKCDVVVGFGHVNTIHLIRASLLSKFKIIGTARMDPILYPAKKLLRIERRLAYRTLDGMILQTTAQQQYFQRFVKRNCFVIPNPVRPRKVQETSVNMRKKKCVTVARLDNQQKNHIFMFRCFEQFYRSHPEYELELYGDGPDRQMYETYIKEHGLQDCIHLCGYSKNPQADIRDAEMFLLTSNHEGMPNALIEAMSLGLPSVCVNCSGGGVKDLIVDGKNGFIVEQNDEEGFVARMKMLAESAELRENMTQEAMKVNDTLEISNIAERWLEAFRCMLNRTEKNS